MQFQHLLKWLSGSDSNAHDLVNSQADCQLSDPRTQIVGLRIICIMQAKTAEPGFFPFGPLIRQPLLPQAIPVSWLAFHQPAGFAHTAQWSRQPCSQGSHRTIACMS